MPRLLFATFGRWESRPPGLEDGRAGPAPHQMRQSGKGAVHPNWTEQQELALPGGASAGELGLRA